MAYCSSGLDIMVDWIPGASVFHVEHATQLDCNFQPARVFCIKCRSSDDDDVMMTAIGQTVPPQSGGHKQDEVVGEHDDDDDDDVISVSTYAAGIAIAASVRVS